MLDNDRLADWDEGYIQGWEEGRQKGRLEGFSDASDAYEERILKLWGELQTLNARMDYLNNQLNKHDAL